MIKTFLRSLRTLAQAVLVRSVLADARLRAPSDATDSWLFEDEGRIQRVGALPAYPGRNTVTDGEQHRLEMLSMSLDAISNSLQGLRRITETAHARADLVIRAAGAADVFAHGEIRLVADLAVTDMLFDASARHPELDADLFEIGAVEETSVGVPAWQIGRSSTFGAAEMRSGG